MAMQALVMGFGGTGAHILTALKELTVLKNGRVPASIKFLLFDTIADWEPGKAVQILGGAAQEKLAAGSEKATSLDPATEYFYLADHDPDLKTYVFKRLSPAGEPDRYPHLKDWLHAPWLSQHVRQDRLNITEGAAQQRQIGRFAMFQNADRIKEKIGQLIRDLSQHAADSSVNIWVVSSAAGGTGAGCFLDAAYLTRLATNNLVDIKLTGVIVLPDVYSGMPGISRARAYSLLREMDRAQEQGIPESDRYVEAGGLVSSRVSYDARSNLISRVNSKLFDDLFYLGQKCEREAQRISFFTSVANAIDPYLDEKSGPVLLQESVNESAAAAAFGAARLYVPVETFAEIFAWQQVETYLIKATAPVEEQGRIIRVQSGSSPDRERRAQEKINNLLDLFRELLDRRLMSEDDNRKYATADSFNPEKIVTGWYQFNPVGPGIAGESLNPPEARTIMLTYINPYYSFAQPEFDQVEGKERTTKTYKENQAAKGPNESQEKSRDRFAEELERATKNYTESRGGDLTFHKGCGLLFDKVSTLLRHKIDRLIMEELKGAGAFAQEATNPYEGTALARLLEEIRHMLGFARNIEEVVGQFVGFLNGVQGVQEQKKNEVLTELRSAKKSKIFGTWVESEQVEAREGYSKYIQWLQKRHLLKDMQNVVSEVTLRLKDWERLISRIFDRLVFREAESALFAVKRQNIKNLESRLYRAMINPSAIVGFESNPEVLKNYRDELDARSTLVRNGLKLADVALADSKWEPEVGQDGLPQLKLKVGGEVNGVYSPDTIDALHRDLHAYFRREIDLRLKNTDIFDYLLYLRRKHDIEPIDVVKTLYEKAKTLINAEGGKEECKLIYKDPQGEDKLGLAAMVQNELARVNQGGITRDPEKSHSDPHSITLLKVKKPNIDQITDLDNSRQEYEDLQIARPNGDAKHDDEVYRTQVYHPFRPEMEAFFIERRYFVGKGEQVARKHIPPRIVRLLENPAMMQAFVHCLATGAVKKVKGKGWIWNDTQNQQEVILIDDNDPDADPEAGLIKAAIVFVLQQRDGRKSSTLPIALGAARQSVIDVAQQQSKNHSDMIEEWRTKLREAWQNNRLREFWGDFLPDNVGTLERDSLTMIFDFYADEKTRTGLQHRMKLV
jgi:tubulin-like protein